MIRNFFKIAVRNLWKYKGYSFLNIFGLAIGITCSLLIFFWVSHEKSMNAFHSNGKNLYTLYERQFYDGKIESGYFTPGPLADEIKRVIPEIKFASAFVWNEMSTFSVGEKMIKKETNAAGKDFFKMFSYPLLEGKPESALATPASIALSKKMAEEFFGSAKEAIGKSIRYQNKIDYTVTAVYDNLPSTSSFKFDCLVNWHSFLERERWAKDWGNNGPSCFIQLRENANPTLVANKIKKFLDNYNKDQSDAFRIELGMQRFDEMYLHSTFRQGYPDGGRIEYVKLFSIVAIFILAIACINFMNLTTARSARRSKEIGVRKVVGALRWALIRQFISEAILLTFFAMVLALMIVLLVLPAFNTLTGKDISFPYGSVTFWLLLLGLTVATGFISGSYPALLLSSFKPIRVLKGTMKFSTGAAWFRKGLVVFQFALSTLLIIGTIVVAKQVSYVQRMNLGYDRENLIYIPLDGELRTKYQLFKQQAASIKGVAEITRITESPTQMENGTGGVKWEGKDPNNMVMFTQAAVGYDFTKTMKLQMTDGRDFSKDFPTDSVAYILNETALKKIGYQNPIGKPLTFWQKKGTIVGVLKDFHFNSMHTPINPLILRLGENYDWGMALIRIDAGKTKQALAGLEKLHKSMNPSFPFTYQFSDDVYQKLYKSEQMVEGLSNWFAFLAIFISCLGLLGLAMFTAEQRTKEFGIRKVLGASVSSLFTLLSKDYLILVSVAFVVASPLAYFAMHKWLQNFAYRTDLPWWIFLIAGVLALAIALITVSFQAVRAATANPIRSLRSE